MERFTFSSLLQNSGVFLAPLAGVSDAAFRCCVRQYSGQGVAAVTEMVSAKALQYNNQKTKEMLFFYPGETLTGIQLFGSDEVALAEAVRRYLNEHPTPFIDINFGCPVKKVVKNGEGSALLADPRKLHSVAKAVVDAAEKPVSAKVRLGVDEEHLNLLENVKALQDAGISLIAVHGRTAKQMYTGRCDYTLIGEAKRIASVPIIANGDINSPEDARRVLEFTGADGVMVGRGAMHDPFLPGRIDAALQGKENCLPTVAERFEAMLFHFERLLEYKGEHLAVLQFRTHFAAYTKGLPASCEMRVAMNRLQKAEQIKEQLALYKASVLERNSCLSE